MLGRPIASCLSVGSQAQGAFQGSMGLAGPCGRVLPHGAVIFWNLTHDRSRTHVYHTEPPTLGLYFSRAHEKP